MQAAIMDNAASKLSLTRPEADKVVIRLTGEWRTGDELPSAEEVVKELGSDSRLREVSFDASGLTGWDSNLLTFMLKVKQWCTEKKVECRSEGLPEGAQRLLKLAAAVPERQGAKKASRKEPFFSRVGQQTLQLVAATSEILAFLGGACVAFARLLHRSRLVPQVRSRTFPPGVGSPGPWNCLSHLSAGRFDLRIRGCHTA